VSKIANTARAQARAALESEPARPWKILNASSATSIDQVWRRRWLALGFAWTVCAVGWLAVALMPDRFQSEARFYVDTQSLLTPLLKGISVNADDRSRDQEVAIMQRTLTSRPNLTRIAQMTDLDKSVNSPRPACRR
jgi:uncharacterized protein involved in exopolysaccharide biosynthesis